MSKFVPRMPYKIKVRGMWYIFDDQGNQYERALIKPANELLTEFIKRYEQKIIKDTPK